MTMMKFSAPLSGASSLTTLLGVVSVVTACASEDPGNGETAPATTDGLATQGLPPNSTPPGTTADPTGTSFSPGGQPSGVVPDPSSTPVASTPAPGTSVPTTVGSTPGQLVTPEPSGGPVAMPAPSVTPEPGPAATGTDPTLPLPDETNFDHCVYGYDPLPSDDTMASGPALYDANGGGAAIDTIVQPEVLQWMTDNKWQGAHVIWHAVRGCADGTARGLLAPLGYPDICQDYPFLVPADQNCKTVGDGYQFLLFHRHMIESLKQLWPKHADDFDGFDKFPTTKEELPDIWNESDPVWNEQILDAAAIGDNIEDHLDLFPDEGSLGFWLQCPVGSRAPSFAPQLPYVGLHFNLHDQWSRGATSDHGLNNGQVNITNYMFWKLHGWIDKVWEKYRVAKGLTTDEAAVQKYKADMVAQCREMDTEIEILQQMPGQGPTFECPPEVDETGEYHEKIRPIFENERNHCTSCHGPALTSPYAGLTLGGAISSKCVTDSLNRESISGGQFKLVEPGDPQNSWLYLKAAGLAESAGCVDGTNACNTATMPPSGRTMTDEELQTLYDWIKSGAN